jgi:outer membrane protein
VRRSFCATVTLALPAASLAQQPAADVPDSIPTVTLSQALQLARTVSPALAAGEANVRAARASRLAVTGEYLPSLGVASSAGRGTTVQGASAVTNGVPVSSAMRPLDDTYGSGISASIPIFTGGRRGADRRSANAQQAAAVAGMTSAEFDVRLATKQAYFDVLRAGELVDVASARVAEGEEAMRDAERRLRAGTSTRSDVLRAQVTLAGARDALATAQAERTAAQYALGRSIGKDGPIAAAPVAEDDTVGIGVPRDSVVALAVRMAPSARAANAAAQSADAAIGSARAQYLPSVLASGGYGWLEQRSVTSHPVGGWTAQVGIS